MANAEAIATRLAAKVPRRIVEWIPPGARAAIWETTWGGFEWMRDPAKRGFLGLRDYLRLRQFAHAPIAGTPIEVQPRCLSAGPVQLRPGTSDAQVLFETFLGLYHLPPAGTRPATVWDLGTNLGLTVAHFAELWPGARIVGVEPQPYLAAGARNLVSVYGPRCRVIEAAVWSTDGSVAFVVDPGNEFGGRVDDERADFSVSSVSLNTLLAETGPVDYVKMDIEGAEETVLRENTEWSRDVTMIKVECHSDYTVADCVRDLEALGFRTRVDESHVSCVLGWRE